MFQFLSLHYRSNYSDIGIFYALVLEGEAIEGAIPTNWSRIPFRERAQVETRIYSPCSFAFVPYRDSQSCDNAVAL